MNAPDKRTRHALTSSQVLIEGKLRPAVLVVEDGKITEIAGTRADLRTRINAVQDLGALCILPGVVDTHVHINEPGRTDWEGFETATRAAAAGGITTLVDMPLNCIPVTTSKEAFETKLDAVRGKLWVDTGFWGGVTPESVKDLPALVTAGVLGVKSFLIDSGIDEFPPMREPDLRKAMPILAAAKLPYLFHAELAPVESGPGQIGSGTKAGSDYTTFMQSRPDDWEARAISLLIRLCEETRCKTHIVHLSSAEPLREIARAKARGLPISAETCPHYLCLTSQDIGRDVPAEERGLFKCCPPIRGDENRSRLWHGLRDGVIDCVVSDHSPCTANLKKLDTGNLDEAWGGIASLQWTLPLVWTEASKHGLSLSTVSHLMSTAPAKLAGLGDRKGRIAVGFDADLIAFDPEREDVLRREDILFKNAISPYIGRAVRGKVMHTFLRGQEIHNSIQPIDTKPKGEVLLHARK